MKFVSTDHNQTNNLTNLIICFSKQRIYFYFLLSMLRPIYFLICFYLDNLNLYIYIYIYIYIYKFIYINIYIYINYIIYIYIYIYTYTYNNPRHPLEILVPGKRVVICCFFDGVIYTKLTWKIDNIKSPFKGSFS